MKETLIKERLHDVLEEGDEFLVSADAKGLYVQQKSTRYEDALGYLVTCERRLNDAVQYNFWTALLLYLVTVVVIQKNYLSAVGIELSFLKSILAYACLLIFFFIVQQYVYNMALRKAYQREKSIIFRRLREFDIDLVTFLSRYSKEASIRIIHAFLAKDLDQRQPVDPSTVK